MESLARALVPLLPLDSTVLLASRTIATEQLLRNPATPSEGLRRFATDLPNISTEPLVVVVDQFEEVYTLCKAPAERATFVDLLLHAAGDASRHVSIVLTLRSDFLGETQRQHPELSRAIAAHHELVPAMSADELRRAIAEPARQAGWPLNDAIVDLLFSQATRSEGALPLLEFALTRVWEGLTAGKEPAATLKEIGGVGGALAQQAQALFDRLSLGEQRMAQRAFTRLVQLGEGTRDTRRRALIGELSGRGESEADVLGVLRQFATENVRLVTLFGDDASTVAEVTHEALFDHWNKLREWISESRADRRFHDRLAEAARLWEADQRPPGRLWRPPDLDLLRDYQKRKAEELNPLQEAFLQAAKRQQRRELWSRWATIATLLVAVLLTTSVYVYLTREHQLRLLADQTSERTRQLLLDRNVEQGRQLLTEKENPTEALLWLHRALAEGSKSPALSDLLRGAMHSVDATKAVLIGHRDSIWRAVFSPNGRLIVTVSKDHTARVWDAAGGRLLAELTGHQDSVWSATFSSDGRRILTASGDTTARVWEAETGRLLARLKGHRDIVWSATFSLDGRRILTASHDHTARLWDAVPETRTVEQLAKLIRCHVLARFDREANDVIVSAMPHPAECQSDIPLSP